MFHYRRPTKSRRVKPWQPSLKPKPKRFTFPHVALIDFGPLWRLMETDFDPEMRRNPDALAAAVATAIPHLNDLAERGGHDLTLISDMRNIYIAEQSGGAADAAAAGDCYLGQFMQRFRCWLEDPKAAKKAQTKTRKYLHKVRRRKAYQLERAAEKARWADAAAFMYDIEEMNARIEIDVRNTIEYRGLSNVGPIRDVGYQVEFRIQPMLKSGGHVPIDGKAAGQIEDGRALGPSCGKRLGREQEWHARNSCGILPIPNINGHVTDGHGRSGRATIKRSGYGAGGGGSVMEFQGGVAARRRELKFEVGDKSRGAKSVFDRSKGGARVGSEEPDRVCIAKL